MGLWLVLGCWWGRWAVPGRGRGLRREPPGEPGWADLKEEKVCCLCPVGGSGMAARTLADWRPRMRGRPRAPSHCPDPLTRRAQGGGRPGPDDLRDVG